MNCGNESNNQRELVIETAKKESASTSSSIRRSRTTTSRPGRPDRQSAGKRSEASMLGRSGTVNDGPRQPIT